MSAVLTTFILCLVTGVLPAQEPQASTYEALRAEYRAENSAHFDARRKQPAASRGKFDSNLITRKYLPRFEQAAAAVAETPEAIPFLAWIVENGGSVDGPRALVAGKTVIEHHAASPAMSTLMRPLLLSGPEMGDDATYELYSAIIAKNGVEKIRERALFQRSTLFIGTTPKGTQEQRVAANADLKRLLKSTTNDYMRRSARKVIFEFENLNIGCTAPEIEGKDLDGVNFKLSDYRGKVVLLDFWGHW